MLENINRRGSKSRESDSLVERMGRGQLVRHGA